jgi:DNA-binding XRE family transcriptional regulator
MRRWRPPAKLHAVTNQDTSWVDTRAGLSAGPGSCGRPLPFPESDFLQALGARLRAMRARRDMSRRELSRRSGISERYIAQIEAGKGNVSIVLLLRLASAIHGSQPQA